VNLRRYDGTYIIQLVLVMRERSYKTCLLFFLFAIIRFVSNRRLQVSLIIGGRIEAGGRQKGGVAVVYLSLYQGFSLFIFVSRV